VTTHNSPECSSIWLLSTCDWLYTSARTRRRPKVRERRRRRGHCVSVISGPVSVGAVEQVKRRRGRHVGSQLSVMDHDCSEGREGVLQED